MSNPLFKGLHYYAQIWGADREAIQQCRRDLDSNGATYCGSPCDPRCNLVIVASPGKSKGHNFATPGKAGTLEAHQKEGTWTFDALCTHFARRATVDRDKLAVRRKNVVVVEWVKKCLEQRKVLTDGRYALYEIIAEDKPHGTPNFRPKATKSARGSTARVQTEPKKGTTDHDSHSRLAETEATLTAEPNLLPFALMQMDNPIDMPPSPPLTATSSMSRAGFVPRVFDSLTQDQWGSRTFYVACQGTGAIEYYIKANGGMLDEQKEATFIIVDAPIEGVWSLMTRRVLGELRRSQKAIHPGWIDKCVQQNAIADFEPFIAAIPFDTISSVSQSEAKNIETLSQPIRDLSRAPSVHSLTVKRKRRQSQLDIDGFPLLEMTPTSAGAIHKATDPRVRPRLSTEVTPNPPSWYRPTPTQHSIQPVTSHHETPVDQLPPRKPSVTATEGDAQKGAGSVTSDGRPSTRTPLSLKPFEGLIPFSIRSDRKSPSFALPILPAPSSSQTMMHSDTIKAELPDSITLPGPTSSCNNVKARTAPDALFHGLSPSSHLNARPRAVSSELEREDISVQGGLEVKKEDVVDHVEVKIEMMETLIQAPSPRSICVSSSSLAELATPSSRPATSSNSTTANTLPLSSNGPQMERYTPDDPTSASIASLSIDAPVSSNDIPPDVVAAMPSPSFDEDNQFSDTLSNTSSEVSAMSDTTCPSDDGLPPDIAVGGDRARPPSAGKQTPTIVKPQPQPLLVTSTSGRADGRSPPGKAKGPPTLVEAARLNELIKDFDKWLQAPTTGTAAEFVKDMEKKKTKFGWKAMYERKKSIIRSRLLLKGYRAALLDSVGILDESDNEPGSTEPTSRLSSDPTLHESQSHPLRLAIDGKLDELVGELHKWLEAGPTELRSDFVKTLGVKKPGYGWYNLYYRKQGSIRRALLAMGSKPEILDAVGIGDVPDYVPGVNQGLNLISMACSGRIQELVEDLDAWLLGGAVVKRTKLLLDSEANGGPGTTLYRRRRHTIFQALLAMGHSAADLKKADIHDGIDVIWVSKAKKDKK